MAKPSLTDLPEEILLNIFQHVRGDAVAMRDATEWRGPRIHWRRSSGTLASLCLASRRLRDPASQVLYQQVALQKGNLQKFLMTITSSPEHAELVRGMFLPQIHGGTYEPEQSFYHSMYDVRVRIKALAQDADLPCYLSPVSESYGPRGIGAHKDLEQAIILRSLPNLRFTDLEFGIGDSAQDCLDLESYLASMIPEYFFKILPLTQVASLTIRFLDFCGDSIFNLLAIVSVPTVKILTVVDLGKEPWHSPYRCGDHDDVIWAASLLDAAFKSPSALESLSMENCRISKRDFKYLLTATPNLLNLKWRFSGESSEFQRVPFSEACLCTTSSQILQTIYEACPKIQTLTFTHIQSRVMSDTMDEESETREWTRFRAEVCDQANVSLFTALTDLELTASVLVGVTTARDQVGHGELVLPHSLRSLKVHMHHSDFYLPLARDEDPEPANFQPGNERVEVIVIRALIHLLQRLQGMAACPPALKTVRVTVPDDWPRLRRFNKLVRIMAGISNVHVSVRGAEGWRLLDSSKSEDEMFGALEDWEDALE